LNFLNNSKFKDIFSDGDFTEDVFVSKINLFFPEKKIEESKKFVIFFDEIQECKNAITSLKFILQFKKYKFDVICSGSYLGIVLFGNKKNESFSWPTGFTQQENMYSMDFEEFL
jgi:predicted AAA+ superfamily ATPase